MKNLIKYIETYGVPALIISLPLYMVRFSFFGIPSTLLELIFWVVFASWFFVNYNDIKLGLKRRINSKFKIQNSKFNYYPFSFFIVLFAVASFIGLAVSGFSNEALGIYKAYFIEAILFYVLVFNYFKNKENRDKVFWSLFLSAFFISLYAVFQKLMGIYWIGGVNELRVTSVFSYPNALGLYLGPITTLLYFYTIKIISNFEFRISNKFLMFQFLKTSFLFLVLIFSLLAIYFAHSEAALGAVLVSIFFGSLFVSKRFAVSFVLLGFVASIIILTNTGLRTFVLEKTQLKDFSGEVRKQQWRETGEMLKVNFNYLMGCGLSGYQDCVRPYHQKGIFFNDSRDPDFRRKIVIFDDKYRAEHWRPVEIYMYPHNIILNFWVELGVLGVIAFLGLIIQFFYFGIRLVKSRKLKVESSRILIIGITLSMIEILIHGTVDVPYFKNDLSFLFWLFFAMMGVYWVELKVKSEK